MVVANGALSMRYPGEGEMGHATWRRGGFDRVVLLDALQSVPQADPSAEHDRHHDDMQVVDEAGGHELANHRRSATDPDVEAVRSLASLLERLGGRRVDEVEGRPAVHLDRRTVVVREHEDGRVERWVGTPPSLP